MWLYSFWFINEMIIIVFCFMFVEIFFNSSWVGFCGSFVDMWIMIVVLCYFFSVLVMSIL